MPRIVINTDGGAPNNPDPVVAIISLLPENPRFSAGIALLSDTGNSRFPTPSRRA